MGRRRILIVDDEPINLKFLIAALRDDYDINVAVNGNDALKCVMGSNIPDMILLDIIMPGMDGYEVCRRLKSYDKTRNIPVIFITALSEVGHETKGFEAGAVDYITKPFSIPIVKARVKTHLDLVHYKTRLEQLVIERTRELEKSLREYEKLYGMLG